MSRRVAYKDVVTIDKRLLKKTLERFSYMTESQLITRIGRLKNIEKINACIVVADKLNLQRVKEHAQLKRLQLYGRKLTGLNDPGLESQVVYEDITDQLESDPGLADQVVFDK